TGMVFSFTACSDTTWVYKNGEDSISAGVYLGNLVESYISATYKDGLDTSKDLFKQEIEGVSAEEYIKQEAKKLSLESLVIAKKFKELGLTVPQQTTDEINNAMKNSWSYVESFYESNGVGEKSYREILTSRKMQELIFHKYYNKDGIEEVANDDLMVHFKDTFKCINIFGIKLEKAEKDKTLTAEQQKRNDDAKKNAQTMLEMLQKGKGFNETYAEYIKIENKTLPEDQQKEIEVKDDNATKLVISNESTNISEKVRNAIMNDLKVGEPMLIEDDNGLYLVVGYDIEKETDKFDEMRDTLLYDIKGEEFDEMLNNWVKELEGTVETNEASVKRYSPKKIK
ncbi:MAG: hypothetical protein RSE93_08580, partial [Oscillospiraceae bacterium]